MTPIRRVLTEVKFAGQRPFQRWALLSEIAVPGPPGPPSLLQDDPDPTLGADLKLNNHGFTGQLDDGTLVIDGGLL